MMTVSYLFATNYERFSSLFFVNVAAVVVVGVIGVDAVLVRHMHAQVLNTRPAVHRERLHFQAATTIQVCG